MHVKLCEFTKLLENGGGFHGAFSVSLLCSSGYADAVSSQRPALAMKRIPGRRGGCTAKGAEREKEERKRRARNVPSACAPCVRANCRLL
jgi:hypothetical protein